MVLVTASRQRVDRMRGGPRALRRPMNSFVKSLELMAARRVRGSPWNSIRQSKPPPTCSACSAQRDAKASAASDVRVSRS